MPDSKVRLPEFTEGFEKNMVDQISGFKRCRLSSPISMDYVSQGFMDILGYTEQELHGLFNDQSVRFVHPDDAEEYRRLLYKFAAEEMTATFHYRVICKDGTVKMLTDTMKSTRINGEMWGFSCVSDSTYANFDAQLASLMLHSENTVLSLIFDLGTGLRVTSAADVLPSQIPDQVPLSQVVANLRMRVGLRSVQHFDDFVNSWHLRERLSMECLMLGPVGEVEASYRWVRISTVCLPDSRGRRIFGITVVDIEDEKQREDQTDRRGGADWLTGLSNFARFHEECLEKGLSGNSAVLSGAGDAHATSRLYSEEFSVLSAARKVEPLRAARKSCGRSCAFVAIWVSLSMTPEGTFALHERWLKIKKVASLLRIIAPDNAVLARADGPMFLAFNPVAESVDDVLDRTRMFKAGADSQLGANAFTSIGIALARVGDDYDAVFASAVNALEKAIPHSGGGVVLADRDGVHYVMDDEGDLANAEDREAMADAPSAEASAQSVPLAMPAQPAAPVGLVDTDGAPHVEIRTFGYFEVYVNGSAVMFSSLKAKELLALMVDHAGGYVTPSFAISRLWESEPCDATTRARYRKVALKLRRTLEEYGISFILDEKNGSRRIAVERVECDLYRYKSGDCPENMRFRGIYLPEYEWGELTLAQLMYETAN